jgi:hypothetical protein
MIFIAQITQRHEDEVMTNCFQLPFKRKYFLVSLQESQKKRHVLDCGSIFSNLLLVNKQFIRICNLQHKIHVKETKLDG